MIMKHKERTQAMKEKNTSDMRRHKRSHEMRETMSHQGQMVEVKETDKRGGDRETEKHCLRNVSLKRSVNQEEHAEVSRQKQKITVTLKESR